MNVINSFLTYLKDELAYSPHTLTAYKNDLEQWRNFVAPDRPEFDPLDITTNDTRAWVAVLSKNNASPASIKRKLSAVRSLYNFLVKRHEAKDNPANRVKVNKRQKTLPKFIDRHEIAALLDNLDKEIRQTQESEPDFISVRNTLIINMLYQTGMRASELVSLTWGQIDTSRCSIKIIGKRNKERVVPFGPDLLSHINRYRSICQIDSKTSDNYSIKVFTDNKGNPLNYRRLYTIVHKLLDGNVSSPKRSPHVLRHTFATDMLNNGANLTGVRKLLGHQSLATTQIYTHVSVAEVYQNYKNAHPRAKKSK